MQASLSVVIPAYNEEANLRRCVDDIVTYLRKQEWDWEIIVVNDGSRDRTGEIAKQLAKRIPKLKVITNIPNLGYGGSLKTGFAATTKDLICFISADNQFDFTEISQLLHKMTETNADIVSGIRVHNKDSLYRLLLRWSWNKLVYALFGHLATDIDCGFKLFKRKILEVVNLTSNGAMIDTQLFAGARARGMIVAEVPVTHLPRTAGASTGGKISVAIKAFKELLAFWWSLRQEIWEEQGRVIFRWEAFALAAVLVIAGISRLYRIGDYMTFLGDEGRDAIVMRDIITLKHFPLIGPGTSIGQMYLGPLYYYFAAPSLLLAGFSPVGPSIQVALVGVLTVGLLWWIGRQWFGRVPAALISILYALSPTVIVHSRSSWNPNIMPFFALLTMYGIWKVWRLGYWQWLIIAAISYAVVLNSHYLGLLLFPTLTIFLVLSRRKPGSTRYLLFAIIIFLFLMSPLVWFDARHGWNNFGAMKQFFSDRQTTVNLKAYKAIPNLWPVWRDVVNSLIVAKQSSLATPVAIGLIGLAAYVYWKRPSKDFLFTVIWISVGVIGLGLYKQHIYDHYYGFMFPAPFLLFGFGLQSLLKNTLTKILVGVVVTVLVIVNLVHSPLRIGPNYQLTRTETLAQFIKQQAGDRPFNLALLAKQNYDASYRYFLQQNQAPYYTIHQQLTEQLFVVCELSDCQPINDPLWEIAAFGWAKIDRQWEFPWGVKVFRLVHISVGK